MCPKERLLRGKCRSDYLPPLHKERSLYRVASLVSGDPFGRTAHDDIAIFEPHEALDLFEDGLRFVDHEVVGGMLSEGGVVPQTHLYGAYVTRKRYERTEDRCVVKRLCPLPRQPSAFEPVLNVRLRQIEPDTDTGKAPLFDKKADLPLEAAVGAEVVQRIGDGAVWFVEKHHLFRHLVAQFMNMFDVVTPDTDHFGRYDLTSLKKNGLHADPFFAKRSTSVLYCSAEALRSFISIV